MVDIVHRVGIKAPVSAVYAALATIDGLVLGAGDACIGINPASDDPAIRGWAVRMAGVVNPIPDGVYDATGQVPYLTKDAVPYRDADGNPF